MLNLGQRTEKKIIEKIEEIKTMIEKGEGMKKESKVVEVLESTTGMAGKIILKSQDRAAVTGKRRHTEVVGQEMKVILLDTNQKVTVSFLQLI